MNCSVCGQPIRVIPTGSKFKDAYNKVVLVLGKVCMRCAIAYKDAAKEAESMTYEERAAKTLERMKAQGMSQKDIDEAVKQADIKEKELKENNKDVEIKVPEINPETLPKVDEGVSKEMMEKIENKGEETMVEAYCMKCKMKRKMTKVKDVKMKNGNPAQKGECEKCGTSMYKIGGK